MWSVQHVTRTGSTNADLATLARDGAVEGTVLVADHQDAGKGRLGRTWHAPAATALTASFLLRPVAVPVMRWSWLPLLTGVAVIEGIAAVVDIEAQLKWPNDVLVEGRKLAGILVERIETPDGSAAVVGVGLNVSQAADDLPPGATSLALIMGNYRSFSGNDQHSPMINAGVGVTFDAIAGRLADQYERWRAADGDPHAELATSYTKYCSTIGQQVRADLPGGGMLTGTAAGIDDVGRLIIEAKTGQQTPVSAGDIVHLRPTRAAD